MNVKGKVGAIIKKIFQILHVYPTVCSYTTVHSRPAQN